MGIFWNKHRHLFRRIDVHYEHYTVSGWRTKVLCRCECGKTKVEQIDGKWDLADLNGEESN